MQFRNKFTDSLSHLTIRIPTKHLNELKNISKKNNWVLSDLARYGIVLALKEMEKQPKTEERELF